LSGRWCGPILSLGLASNGIEIWKTWDVITEEWYAILDDLDEEGRQAKKPVSGAGDRLRLTPRASGWTWTEGIEVSELNQAFVGFMKKWDDKTVRDSLKTAISLYVEANQASGGTESAIVLLQSALELLASLHADEHLKGRPCKNRFNDIGADERIRWLLEDLEIPVEIPSDTKDLKSYSNIKLRDNEYKDGPKAITYLRNGIIHPSRKLTKRLNETEDKIKLQALSLGIWYVEMVLLRLFNYKGHYANRLWRFHDSSYSGGMGFLQLIPWETSSLDCECDNCPILNKIK
jgi:hypothetical protein